MSDEFHEVKIEVQIPYGLDKNYRFVSEDVMAKALENSKNIPLVDYRKDDRGVVIGMATKDIVNKNGSFIGEFAVWHKSDVLDDTKCGMSFKVIESHKEGGCVVFDEIKIDDVSVLKG